MKLELDTDRMIAEVRDGIGWVIYNNPKRLNAVSLEMTEALPFIFDTFEELDEVRVVVIPRGRRPGLRVGRRHLGVREEPFVRGESAHIRREGEDRVGPDRGLHQARHRHGPGLLHRRGADGRAEGGHPHRLRGRPVRDPRRPPRARIRVRGGHHPRRPGGARRRERDPVLRKALQRGRGTPDGAREPGGRGLRPRAGGDRARPHHRRQRARSPSGPRSSRFASASGTRTPATSTSPRGSSRPASGARTTSRAGTPSWRSAGLRSRAAETAGRPASAPQSRGRCKSRRASPRAAALRSRPARA